MKSLKENQSGFGFIEIILVVVIAGLLVAVGWYVLKAKKNAITSYNSAASSTTVTKPAAKPKVVTKVDLYAGWKTYCDKATRGCLRYPGDWDNIAGADGATALSATNKNETLTLEYAEPVDGMGGLGDFLTKSIESLSVSGNSYKIVGGYYTVSNVPGYYLVDSSLDQRLGLAVGKVTKITNNDLYLTFASKKATFVVHYNTAASGGASRIDASKANVWFASTDGKIALKSVQSFYKK